MSGRNVVPMPAQGQLARNAPQATQGQMMPMPMTGTWPMPPGGFPAGCCPPGGMDALLQCYCDIQAATAFISKVVQDLAANDPAFQQSLVDAIAASGSNIPLIGVTNGSDALAGQVGEYGILGALVPYTAGPQTQTVALGVIQPGDWDMQLTAYCPDTTTGVNISLTPLPVGVSGINQGFFLTDSSSGVEQVVCTTPVFRASFSVPTLIPVLLLTNQNVTAPNGGTLQLQLFVRRMR